MNKRIILGGIALLYLLSKSRNPRREQSRYSDLARAERGPGMRVPDPEKHEERIQGLMERYEGLCPDCGEPDCKC